MGIIAKMTDRHWLTDIGITRAAFAAEKMGNGRVVSIVWFHGLIIK